MAGKKGREVSKADARDIYHYIDKKLKLERAFPSETDNFETYLLAVKNFKKIECYPKIDAKELLNWCKVFLSDAQWENLKVAIRMMRHRHKKKMLQMQM